MAHQGGCLCGAVRFEIDANLTEAGACHCGMCRKHSGGVFLAVKVSPAEITFLASDTLRIFASSNWAERGFCETCGSSLFYRVTAPGPYEGTYHVGLGALDEANGITLNSEIYVDRKPDGYAFAGNIQYLTEAQVLEMLGVA